MEYIFVTHKPLGLHPVDLVLRRLGIAWRVLCRFATVVRDQFENQDSFVCTTSNGYLVAAAFANLDITRFMDLTGFETLGWIYEMEFFFTPVMQSATESLKWYGTY